MNVITEIDGYIEYLQGAKHSSNNTIQSYRRDLIKLKDYLAGKGVTSVKDINSTLVRSYVLSLENGNFSSATVSRNIASIRSFFIYLVGVPLLFVLAFLFVFHSIFRRQTHTAA